MTAPLYEVEGLSFSYMLGALRVDALREVTLTVERGATVVFSGPSGSGKTTLLNVLGLIEPVQTGRVRFEGNDLAQWNERARNQTRKHKLGFIFQQFHLVPVLSAEENVAFFLARQGVARAERDTRVKAAMEAVGLWEHRTKRPLEMSGGQRQRVAIARALAKRPDVVLADEPTASLDQTTGRGIMELLLDMQRQSGVTLLVASHDPMVHGFATRHIRVKDGRLSED